MRITLRLYDFLKEALRALHSSGRCRDLGEVLCETGYRIRRKNWLVPDVSITHSGQAVHKYLEGAPALAIEVISEANTARTMHRKVREYLANGSREAWVFYPETKSVSVFRGKTAVEIEGVLTSDLLPGVSIDLTAVPAPEPPSQAS